MPKRSGQKSRQLNAPEMLPLVRWFGQRSPVALGCVIGVVLGGIGSTALFFAPDAAEAYRSGMQLWITALLVGYVVGIVLLEIRRSGAELERLPGWDPARYGAAGANPFAVNRHRRTLIAFTLGGIAYLGQRSLDRVGTLGQRLLCVLAVEDV